MPEHHDQGCHHTSDLASYVQHSVIACHCTQGVRLCCAGRVMTHASFSEGSVLGAIILCGIFPCEAGHVLGVVLRCGWRNALLQLSWLCVKSRAINRISTLIELKIGPSPECPQLLPSQEDLTRSLASNMPAPGLAL